MFKVIKKDLNARETILLSSMLFGMFFGAGNLIFPASLGISAGSSLAGAFIGLFITAVGLPLLAVASLGISRCDGVFALSSGVGKRYGKFFSTLLYLTIGPLFAIPRCASTPFAVDAAKLINGGNEQLLLAIFSLVFFIMVLSFALKPRQIMIWIGRFLNPVFLVFLFILVIVAIINPVNSITSVTPAAEYETGITAFFSGFLEGYNTLDALAGLAFGIVVVEVIKNLGIKEPKNIAVNTVKAGAISCLFMGVIYFAITLISAQSYEICKTCTDGGAILGTIADYYFGNVGAWLMAAIVTIACLKTAIGLVTSCAQAFTEMFPNGPAYKTWTILFCIVSFGIANFGLSSIVTYCVPVLMFIYPLAITIILLALTSKLWGDKKSVYVWTTVFTLVAAVFDFSKNLSETLHGSGIGNTVFLDSVTNLGTKILPLFEIGLGWVCPAIIGFVIGLLLSERKQKISQNRGIT